MPNARRRSRTTAHYFGVVMEEISQYGRGDNRYHLIRLQIKDTFDSPPDLLTEVLFKPLPDLWFSEETIDQIDLEMSKFVAGQICLQFGTLEGVRVFWGENGRLSGAGSIHLFAHILLAIIKRKPRQLLRSFEEGVTIAERIYWYDDSRKLLAITFTGEINCEVFGPLVRDIWTNYKDYLLKSSQKCPVTRRSGCSAA